MNNKLLSLLQGLQTKVGNLSKENKTLRSGRGKRKSGEDGAMGEEVNPITGRAYKH